MKSETYIPCDVLKPFVKSFTIQEITEETTYKVLPDTGLVIGFQFKGKLSHLKDQNDILLSSSGISGLTDHYRTFKNSADIGTVLIFFRDAGASFFFKQSLHELFRESVSLENFMLRSELLILEEQLCEAKSGIDRIEAIEKFLVARMNATEPDKLVLAALALIHKSRGNIRVSQLMEQLHISQSPLEKRFRQAVGTSPKKFASIVRFKNTIRQYNSSDTLTKLGYEAGFYDQAHFIKEFKTFTGETPETFFTAKKR